MKKVPGPITEGEEKGFNKRGIHAVPSEVVYVDPQDIARWNTEHANSIRPAIEEIDRQNARSAARAPDIVVSNATDDKK
jgi:hypothetical protein